MNDEHIVPLHIVDVVNNFLDPAKRGSLSMREIAEQIMKDLQLAPVISKDPVELIKYELQFFSNR